jgi:type I restriction enzyme S subunit
MNNSAEAKVEVGFKQTEVGLIPEDWSCIKFGELISKLCYGPRFNSKDYSKSGNVKTIRGTDINSLGDILYEQVPIAQLPTVLVNEHKLIDGDLVMITTADCGLTGVYLDDGFSYIASAYAVRISLNKKAYPLFFKYIYQTNLATEQIELYIRKGTLGNLPGSDIYKLKFPLPPTLFEQKAIATALSDVDELINSLEKLIAKKKAIKQGAMQELLGFGSAQPTTPRKRLPEFSGDWVERKLGEIGDCIIGLTYSPSDVSDLGTLVLRSSNIQNNKLSFNDNVYVTSDIPEKLRNQMGDILICVRNGSRNLIGKSAKIDERCSGETFGAFMSIFRSKYNDFLYHCFNSYPIKKQIEENLGATINQITNKTLNSFDVWMPKDEKEMYSISNLLDDMDLEIDSLETKKEKYKSVKAGMMQELLTGKIRLV